MLALSLANVGPTSANLLEFGSTCVGDPLGGIQDFERKQVSVLVMVETNGRFVLFTFGYRDIGSEEMVSVSVLAS
jgi:hypothetical protein